MSIKTTMNIDKNVYSEISNAAKQLGKTKSEIIILLLKKLMNENPPEKFQISVKYQKPGGEDCWQKFHIGLREDDYDFFTDMRKFFKKTVSYLVAIAVKKYMKLLLDGKFIDSKLYNNYIILKDEVDGSILWRIFWGFPFDLEKYIHLTKL